MLDNEALINVIRFQRELLKLQFDDKVDFTFAQRTMELLDSVMGYETAIMAHLYTERKPVMVPTFQIHNVDMHFAEELYLMNKKDEELFGITDEIDSFRLSRIEDYRKSDLYRNVFRKYGYDDCILKFIRYPDNDSYMSYIALISRKGLFGARDEEILDAVGPSIAQAFSNALTIWDVRTRYQVFRKTIDNFPIGIMLIEKRNNVVFTNAIAQEYMKELGNTDPVFYSAFYTNKIFPYYQNDVFGYQTSFPLRIKNFIFRVIPTSNEGPALNEILSAESSAFQPSAREVVSFYNMEACVYIIRDETPRIQGTQDIYDSFNLTKREREVMELILSGFSNNDIAEKLVLSFNKVKIHVSNIYRKAGVSNRIDLINKVRQQSFQDK